MWNYERKLNPTTTTSYKLQVILLFISIHCNYITLALWHKPCNASTTNVVEALHFPVHELPNYLPTYTAVLKSTPYMVNFGFQAFLFLCTFVPGSEKTIERTFAPVELSFHGIFAPWNFRSCGTFVPQERRFQELSFHGTFAPVELSFLGSERSKNFRKVSFQ